MIRWLARNFALYVMLLAAASLVYWMWYDDDVARSVIQSIVVSVGLPTIALSIGLYPLGRHVSPIIYRLAALTVALIGGCAAIFGDYRVLMVQLTVQVIFGLFLSRMPNDDA